MVMIVVIGVGGGKDWLVVMGSVGTGWIVPSPGSQLIYPSLHKPPFTPARDCIRFVVLSNACLCVSLDERGVRVSQGAVTHFVNRLCLEGQLLKAIELRGRRISRSCRNENWPYAEQQ